MSVQVVMESQTDFSRLAERMAEISETIGGRDRSGAELLECLPDMPIGIILAAKELPDMSGFELTRRIRTQEVSSINTYVPVVLVGEAFTQDEVTVAIKSGVNQVIRTPVTAEELEKKLAVAFEWKR